ncbi:MAG: sulfurtransferase TusA family protein [Candidatus Bipolaricaulia bacterium]
MKVKVDRELDLKGEVCPYTFVKTKLALEEMEVGQVLKVTVDYKPASRNIPLSAEMQGHEMLDVSEHSDLEWEILLRKGSSK